MKEILELMEKNYPGTSTALLIYDDKSGCLVKDSTISAYTPGNEYFHFRSLEELKEKLSTPPELVVYEDTLLGDVDEEFHY